MLNAVLFLTHLLSYNEGFLSIKKRFVLLLTTCVQPPNSGLEERQERISMYTKVIHFWLQNTQLHIVVIESTGYNFPGIKRSNRIIVLTDKITEPLPSSSQYEARSILFAVQKLVKLPDDVLIIKVTGRYFIPGLESELANIPANTDIILQSLGAPIWQNSELFGFRKKFAKDIFSPLITTGLMEAHLASIQAQYKWYKLKPLQLAWPERRGGDKALMYEL